MKSIQIILLICYKQLKWKNPFNKVDTFLEQPLNKKHVIVLIVMLFLWTNIYPLASYTLTIVHWSEYCRIFQSIFCLFRFNFRVQYSTEWIHFRSGTGCRNPCFNTWTRHVSISRRWRLYHFSRIRLFCCIATGEHSCITFHMK